MVANSSSYVPSAGLGEAGLKTCPGRTRVLKLVDERSQSLGVQMQAWQGATNIADCVCEEGTFDEALLTGDSVPRCQPCPKGALCPGGMLLPIAAAGYAQLEDLGPSDQPVFVACKGKQFGCPGGTLEPSAHEGDQGSIRVVHVERVPYRCGTGYLNGSSACHRCENGYGMRGGHCEPCSAPGSFYLAGNLLFVLVWFPVLRAVLTQCVR